MAGSIDFSSGWDTGTPAHARIMQVGKGTYPVSYVAKVFATAHGTERQQGLLSEEQQTSNGNYFRLVQNLEPIEARSRTGSGTPVVATHTTSTPLNEWADVGGSFASTSDMRVYLNGVLGATNTSGVTPGTLNMIILGANAYHLLNTQPQFEAGRGFPGKIAHAAIYNVALTTADHEELASGKTPAQVKPDNLVAYWPGQLIEIGGVDKVEDVVGDKHLDLFNGAVYSTDGPPLSAPRIIRPATIIRAQSATVFGIDSGVPPPP